MNLLKSNQIKSNGVDRAIEKFVGSDTPRNELQAGLVGAVRRVRGHARRALRRLAGAPRAGGALVYSSPSASVQLA